MYGNSSKTDGLRMKGGSASEKLHLGGVGWRGWGGYLLHMGGFGKVYVKQNTCFVRVPEDSFV